MHIYPDKNYNPVSSMRRESLRDTYEDYEYFYLLNEMAEQLEKKRTGGSKIHTGRHGKSS